MVDSLFIYGINAEDNVYNFVRDEHNMIEVKSFTEKLWRTYRQYADTNFKQQILMDFDPVFGKCI